jgi:MSHA biogenesis protein MshQ
MMIVIAVAGSLVTYAWVMGYLSFTTAKAGRALQIQSVANSNGDLVVYVQNVGEGTVALDPTMAAIVYVNGGLYPLGSMIPADGLLLQGVIATLTVPGQAAGPGERVRIRVVSMDGTFTEATSYPGETTGGGSAVTLYRKSIAFDQGGVIGTLAEFPVLISLASDVELAANAHDQGWDIQFTSEDGTIILNHEIELFDGETGQLIAWVKVPLIMEGTVIYMVYGDPEITASLENPTGVWDSNYVGVWHLGESGSGAAAEYEDSTIYNNHGQGGGGSLSGVPTQDTGKIGYAQDFEGNAPGDFISLGSPGSLEITGSITIEAWINVESWNPEYWHMIVARQYGTSYGDGYLLCLNDGGTAYIIVNSNSATRSGVTTGTWYHVVGVASGTTRRVYVNGVGGTAGSGVTWTLDANPILIGSGENNVPGTDPTEEFDGIIDEVRISNIVRSAEWIQTEYNNQLNPNAFYTLGAET